MKLLKALTESNHPSHLVDITLKEIISAGKVTNPYQTYVLGVVSNAVKDGVKLDSIEFPSSFSGGTDIDLVKAMKALTDQEAVSLAQYLLDCIATEGSALQDHTQSLNDWTKYVLHRQD